MNISKELRLTSDQYFQQGFTKTQVYLHHTVGGSAKSTFAYWQGNADRIATAYIIERDGTIYEVFDPMHWAWHLGLKTASNGQANKQSIGIELASEGALRSGFELNTMCGQKRFEDTYLYAFDIDPLYKDGQLQPKSEWFKGAKKLYSAMDTGKFFDLPVGFRGYHFFDAYDEPQIVAAIELVNQLCEQFNIPKKLIPNQDKFQFDESLILGFSGILTHANVRADKSDLCPAWDWDRLANALV